ncbi:MAG TPA: hypothetical protein PKL77_00975 [Candidatus Omnitrophota bacterium]|nr:hypothetical protein [Candidatus Omnitrophota bacterium]
MRTCKGQSTLEYVIILTAVIAVILVFAGTVFKKNVQNSAEHVSGQMETQVNRISY